jgi:pyrroline-5-carboxylate reductase
LDNLGVIGVGTMAQAIVRSMKKKKDLRNLKYSFFTPSKIKAMELSQELNGVFCPTPDVMKECTNFLIACKPQQFNEMAEEFNLNKVFNKDSLIISIMAGIETKKIVEKLKTPKVIRIMPNTPLLVNRGTSLFYFSDEVTQDEQLSVKNLFDGISKNFTMHNEKQLDQLSGVSGSGPAFFYEFALSMLKNIKKCGLEENEAKSLAIETFIGSATLLDRQLEQTKDLDYLRNQVTSKGGITESGLEHMRKKSMDKLMEGVFNAAYRRAQELNK